MRSILVAAMVLAAVHPAVAQEDAWGGRARVSVSAGLQPEAKGFSQESTLVDYVEEAPVRAVLEQGGAPFFDIGLTVPIRNRVGLHVALSSMTAEGTAAIEAGIPHPFFFNTPRLVSGEATLERRELALHGGLAVLLGGEPVDVTISGGATYFRIRQDLVTDVEFDEAYPFDTATFVSATLSEAEASKVGYYASADLTWRISRVFGIGALVRWSRAEIPLSVDDVEAAPVTVGGLQAAAGIRLTF